MKYLILPWLIPISRFIAALFLVLIRLILYVFAAIIDLWNWKAYYLTEMWTGDFWDCKPSIALPNTKYKVYTTFIDYVKNNYTIHYTS